MFTDSDTDYESESESSTVMLINDLNESDTDNESIDEFDIESDDEFDDIYQEDSLHLYSEKQHDTYYIGKAKQTIPGLLIMINSVSPNTFFKYSFKRICEYLSKYGIIYAPNAKIHIMKLFVLEDETYSVILKTYWIRLIQRHWKKIFNERKQRILARCSLKNQIYRQLRGRYPPGLNYIPSIFGMLSVYNNALMESH